MNTYVPLESTRFAFPSRSQERRLLYLLLRWYDLLTNCLLTLIILLAVIPIARHWPVFLLWPAGAVLYTVLSAMTSKREYLTNGAVAARRWLAHRWPPHPATDGIQPPALVRWSSAGRTLANLSEPFIRRCQAVLLFAMAIALMIVVRRAQSALHISLDDGALWLLYVQPIQLIARGGSIRWVMSICCATVITGFGLHMVLDIPILFDTWRGIAIKGLWLALVSLLPMILVMYLSDRDAALNTVRRVLQQIAAVRLPIDHGFANAVAEIIASELGYAYVNLFLVATEGNEEGVKLVGTSNPSAQHLVTPPFFLEAPRGATNWAAAHKQACLLNNVHHDPWERYVAHEDYPDTQAELALPIMLGDTMLGILDLQSRDAFAFSRDDVDLLEGLTTHLAVTLDAAQNLARAKGLHAVSESAARQFVASQDATPALKEIVEVVWQVLQADSVVLYWRNHARDQLKGPICAGNIRSYSCPAYGIEAEPDSIVFRAMRETAPYVLRRANAADQLSVHDRPGPRREESFLNRERLQVTLVVPLRAGEWGTSDCTGVIFVNYRSQRRVDDATLEWCRTLGDMTVLVLQNAALFERAVSAERAGLRREVHDGMAQYASFTRLLLETITGSLERSAPSSEDGSFIETQLTRRHSEMLKLACQLSQSLQQEVNYLLKTSAQALAIPPGGLFSSLIEYAAIVRMTLGIECWCTLSGQDSAIQSDLAFDVERIIREAVRNAQRHGRASAIHIGVRVHRGSLFMRVRDNGSGFHPDLVVARGGLDTMRERAEKRGGRFLPIRSNCERGQTLIRVVIPCGGPMADAAPLPAPSTKVLSW